MLQKSGYISLRRAAQQLGVHEQTLRSWERKGLIHLARLPKSGYRRVPVEEVQRIQAAMLSDNTLGGVRCAPPNGDAAVLTQAQSLAATVRAELADLGSTLMFDEFMQARRGADMVAIDTDVLVLAFAFQPDATTAHALFGWADS